VAGGILPAQKILIRNYYLISYLSVKFCLYVCYLNVIKVGKVHPRTGHEGPKVHSLTSALDGMGGQRQVPAALLPVKRHGIVLQQCGWNSGLGWTGVENLSTIGIRSLDRQACSGSLNRVPYAYAHFKVILLLNNTAL